MHTHSKTQSHIHSNTQSHTHTHTHIHSHTHISLTAHSHIHIHVSLQIHTPFGIKQGELFPSPNTVLGYDANKMSKTWEVWFSVV